MITNLCDIEPVMGVPDQRPEYFSEANVFVPHENIINLVQHVNDPPSFVQRSVPFLQGKIFIKILILILLKSNHIYF